MSAPKIRASYDDLAQITRAFQRQADVIRQSTQKIKSQTEVLRSGDWAGQGAQAYFNEMDGQILPALGRLYSALDEAGRVTSQISKLMKAAEDEAARLLRSSGEAGGDPGGTVGSAAGIAVGAVLGGAIGGVLGAAVGAAVGGAAGEAIGQVVGGGAGGSSAGGGAGQPGNPLLARDANSLFSDRSLKGMVGSSPTGSDSAELRSAMYELSRNPTGADLDRVLHNIADIRGVPIEAIQAQHEKFLEVRAQAEQIRRERGLEEIPALNTTFHEQFMGSTPQMRFGQMVGDAFGIDPVFGAMLSPTGGMVGPGNKAFTPSNTSVVGYHGVAHDAAGYLYNYHGAGPGYDYLNREGLDRGNPLTGQVSGMRYWTETIHPSTTPIFQVKDAIVDFTVTSARSVGRLISNAGIF